MKIIPFKIMELKKIRSKWWKGSKQTTKNKWNSLPIGFSVQIFFFHLDADFSPPPNKAY